MFWENVKLHFTADHKYFIFVLENVYKYTFDIKITRYATSAKKFVLFIHYITFSLFEEVI